MRLDLGQIEVVDDRMAAVLRSKTGADRLRIIDALYRTARQLIEASVRELHPDWEHERVYRETVRRLSHGAL
jgi:hypothetical protein